MSSTKKQAPKNARRFTWQKGDVVITPPKKQTKKTTSPKSTK